MSQVADQPAPADAAAQRPIVRASGLKKSFKMGESEVHVLKHVDLSIRRGEFLAIEGRSGSGKSTLLHILAGLDAPDDGVVDFEGTDIAALAGTSERWMRWLRRRRVPLPGVATLFDLINLTMNRADRELARVRNTHFGFVFQFYHLLPELNVLENTLLTAMIEHSWLGYAAKRSELNDRGAAVLKQLGMDHRLKHRPNQLSGGERQRVAIARALLNSPKVLFADEPTGNLDAETGRQIMSVFEALHREHGQTIVMVTHDRTLARQADRALVLKEGALQRPADSKE
jgi:lipoprotein-releasing system ATP-binding protein